LRNQGGDFPRAQQATGESQVEETGRKKQIGNPNFGATVDAARLTPGWTENVNKHKCTEVVMGLPIYETGHSSPRALQKQRVKNSLCWYFLLFPAVSQRRSDLDYVTITVSNDVCKVLYKKHGAAHQLKEGNTQMNFG